MSKDGLTDKQQAFCREYIKDFNATQAAIRAGYSKKTAYSQGQRLLKNVVVKVEIGRLLAEIEAVSTVEIAEIVQELRKLAFSGTSYLNNTDKLRALELLGRYKAMFTDKYQDTGQTKLPALTPAEQERYKLLAKNLSKPAKEA